MIVAANWKMNLNSEYSKELATSFRSIETDHEMIVFPSILNINEVSTALEGSQIKVGMQNFYPSEEGSVTGEVSLAQVPKKVEYVMVGHSERRNLMEETPAFIKTKLSYALESGYKAVLCVGETLEQRRKGKTLAYIGDQLESCLPGIALFKQIIVAYEPIWSIGTGIIPKEDELERVASFIKASYNFPVLYGGSVTPENVSFFTQIPSISGVLVGGASLEYTKFWKLVRNM